FPSCCGEGSLFRRRRLAGAALYETNRTKKSDSRLSCLNRTSSGRWCCQAKRKKSHEWSTRGFLDSSLGCRLLAIRLADRFGDAPGIEAQRLQHIFGGAAGLGDLADEQVL